MVLCRRITLFKKDITIIPLGGLGELLKYNTTRVHALERIKEYTLGKNVDDILWLPRYPCGFLLVKDKIDRLFHLIMVVF